MSNYLSFSDSAKYADIARNLLMGDGFHSKFNFWGYNLTDWVLPFMPYSVFLSFKILGINDLAVIATSIFYFLISLVFVFLLVKKIYKDNLISFLSTIVVGFSYDLINYATSGASESLFMFELIAGFYFLSLKNWRGNLLGIVLMAALYFTRPQAIIYIIVLILYIFIINFGWKKGVVYAGIVSLFVTVTYLSFSKQGLIAVTQNLPGTAVSNSLRGDVVRFNLLSIVKKLLYNLYNFYKALPAIASPYMWGLFVIGMFSWGKNKIQNAFKVSVLFMTLLTFLVAAITIPFYRYIQPVIPFVYIVAVMTLVDIVRKLNLPKFKHQLLEQYKVQVVSTLLVLFFVVGQTLGVLILDSRFKNKTVNKDKPPIYVVMSYKLKEVTNADQVILTNLDTWGSWYGERKTVWFPLEPEMILPVEDKIDAIYLTSYKIDDENYYMGENWREIFNNPAEQTILPDYKLVGEYEFNSSDTYERESGRAVLLVRE